MSLLSEFPHRCNVRGSSHARTALGGDSPTPEERLTGIECWVQPASQGEISAYQRRDQRVTHSVYFPEDRSVEVDETIVVTSGQTPVKDKTLKVLSYDEDSAGQGVVWKAMVEQEESP